MRLAIVIPLANEEQTVPELLGRVVAQLGPDDAVFCIVDQASRDNTRAAVENWTAAPASLAPAAGQPGQASVHCLWAPENRCVVDAYFRGYREAMAAGAEWILEMDGGLSHRPEEIPRFIAAMQAGAEFAGGSRFLPDSNYHDSRFSRWLTSRGGTWLANLLLGTRMKDMTSGFECFSRPAMQRVLDHGVRSRAHFFQTEIRYLMHPFNWVEVPISYSCPSKRVGKNSLLDALACLWHLWREHRANQRQAPPGR